MKILSIFFACLFAAVCFAQSQNDSIAQSKLFAVLKPEFQAYEATHGNYLQTNNVKMHYLTWGKPSGTPLIWAHGTYSNAYELLEIVDSLVSIGFYVVAIDYYGHGFTPIPKKPVSLYHVADDMAYLMDKLKIKKAVIGGWSRGGSIATAFYDAYPERTLALILEDGGSVAWNVNNHKKPIDSLTAKTIESYKNRQDPTYNTDFETYWAIYNYWGFKWKTGLKLKKEVFTTIAAIKQDKNKRFVHNPGIQDLVCEHTADQNLRAMLRPFAANNLFGASTQLLYPKIIYRNLHVPLLIFDPLSKDDWFDFEAENTALQAEHPNFITHKIYKATWHGVKDERPSEYLKDIALFLKKVKNIKVNK
jgi:pimeloyl-ACP methyl ester carboxylesterase